MALSICQRELELRYYTIWVVEDYLVATRSEPADRLQMEIFDEILAGEHVAEDSQVEAGNPRVPVSMPDAR